MKFLQQFGWILFYSLLGELISYLLPLPIPGSVIGMLLLFLSLHYNLIHIEKVDSAGTWLTQNMAILFVPAGVGLMVYFNLLISIWWQILLIVLVSTSITIISVGKIVELSKKIRERKNHSEKTEV